MPRVLLNALASTAGGGITYLKNVLPRLARSDRANSYLALVPPESVSDYAECESERVQIATMRSFGGAAGRLLLEQTRLKSFVRAQRIDVLVSLGNFALLGAHVPQILFNRNDLYFSGDFARDLKARRLYLALAAHRLKAALARASIRQAQINVAPTAAFAKRIRAYNGLSNCQFEVLPFGFDPESFTADQAPLPAEQVAKLRPGEDCRRLLYVSHYNYYRNFETLIRALPLIRAEIAQREGRKVLLVLTTEIKRGAVYGGYDATRAAELIEQLGVGDDIAMLGAVAYGKLHQLYRVCDLFVCPSYSESFGHPLVEAMASMLPVVAAGLEVQREVCGDAALYFEPFDAGHLARQCLAVLSDQKLAKSLKVRGVERARQFSWDEHVNELVRMIERCSAFSPQRGI